MKCCKSTPIKPVALAIYLCPTQVYLQDIIDRLIFHLNHNNTCIRYVPEPFVLGPVLKSKRVPKCERPRESNLEIANNLNFL